MSTDDLSTEIASLHKKLDRVLELLETVASSGLRRTTERSPKREKLPPLTEEEIKQQQARFQELFALWLAGSELEVQNELEAADAEALRRFADANNLNITAKTPKTKALQLIAARFREKRQLMQGLTSRREGT